MKKIFLTSIVFACIFIAACVTPKNYRSYSESQLAGEAVACGVGDEFFKHELMYGQDNGFGTVHYGDAKMIVLTVVGLTEKTLSLQYAEYVKASQGPARGFRPDSPWLIRDKYSQRFDYDLSAKKIKFRSYEFDVIENQDGSLKYRRTQ